MTIALVTLNWCRSFNSGMCPFTYAVFNMVFTIYFRSGWAGRSTFFYFHSVLRLSIEHTALKHLLSLAKFTIILSCKYAKHSD